MSPTDPASGAGCPPTETLADYARGRLDEARRAAVEGHLAGCSLCRAIAGGLGAPSAPPAASRAPATAGAAAPGDAPPAPSARRRWLLLAVLAALAVGAWWWFAHRGASPEPAHKPPPSVEDQLATAVRQVTQARPDLFTGFALLDSATLHAAPPAAPPGGIAVVAPRGTVLGTRPAFRWLASGRAQIHTLSLRGADGKEAWSKRIEGVGTPFPADVPELPRGSSWTWTVRAKRSSGPVEGSLDFRVASAEEVQRFTEMQKVVGEHAPASVAALLTAEVAVRADLLEEAERLLAPPAGSKPHAGLEADLRAYVRGRLGLDAGR